MPSLLDSHDLMMLISFADVKRTPTAEEVEARVNEARREWDALIRRLVVLSTEEANVPLVRQEILDMLDCIEAYVYNSKFRGTIICLINALSELCEMKDIKILKGLEHDVRLLLQEEDIRMTNLTSQQNWVLGEIGLLVRDVD